jgi:hypothetical protein
VFDEGSEGESASFKSEFWEGRERIKVDLEGEKKEKPCVILQEVPS